MSRARGESVTFDSQSRDVCRGLIIARALCFDFSLPLTHLGSLAGCVFFHTDYRAFTFVPLHLERGEKWNFEQFFSVITMSLCSSNESAYSGSGKKDGGGVEEKSNR